MRVVRRDNGAKVDIPSTDLVEHVQVLLDRIQDSLFETAKQKRDACIEVVHTWDEFTAALNDKKLILAPWCDEEVSEGLVHVYYILHRCNRVSPQHVYHSISCLRCRRLRRT